FKLLARTTRPAKDKDTKQAKTRKAFERSPRALDPRTSIRKRAGLCLDGLPGRQRRRRASRFSPAMTTKLWTLKMRAIKPIERLVPVSYTHYCASTPGLSTWWSTTVLKGILVLRWVSRLDAFSGYPVRT